MTKKPVITGHIKLYGELVSVKLIKKNPTGSRTVQLLQDIRCHSEGDRLVIKPGEFITNSF